MHVRRAPHLVWQVLLMAAAAAIWWIARKRDGMAFAYISGGSYTFVMGFVRGSLLRCSVFSVCGDIWSVRGANAVVTDTPPLAK